MTIAGNPPWKMTADRVTGLRGKEVFTAEGHVRIYREGETIEADQARYHAATKTAEVRGNVVMTSADFKIVCQRAVVNLELNIGKIYDGSAFFPENHYYVSGDEIERTGPDTFQIIQGRATSCDGPDPAWTLTGSNIRIEREGFATAGNAAFRIKSLPLLYLPWMKVPVKTKRQSGLLLPGIGNSSQDGFTWSQPIYWAISDSKDMTLYLTYMTERGLDTTAEFRYNDWGGKGVYRMSYLNDQNPPLVDYPEPTGSRYEEDRFWLRGMSDFSTESGFLVKFDLDYVSDPEYLKDFNKSFTGFQNTNDVFLQEFGRELNEYLDPLRKSTLEATTMINKQYLRMALEYTDNLDDPENWDTVQRLPTIDLILLQTEIPGTPFYFSHESEYTFFTRRSNEDSAYTGDGHRLDIWPQVLWPVKLGRFLDLETTLGVRETLYYPFGMKDDQNGSGTFDADGWNNQFYARTLYNAEIEASTNISRIFDLGFEAVPRLKHRIRPEVSFSFVPDVDQDDLPYWDGADRVAEEQRVTYGVNNYLVAKLKKPAVYPRASGDESSEFEYSEFLRLGVFRTYDFVESRRTLDSDWTLDFRHPHGPWQLELELDLGDHFWVQAATHYDSYQDDFTYHSAEFMAQDHRGDYLYLEYALNLEPYIWDQDERSEAEYEEVHFLLNLALNEDWAFQYENRYSFFEDTEIETVYALEYQPQCWGVRLEYQETPDENQVAVYFSLLGLGEVGGYSHTTNTNTPTPVETESSVDEGDS